MNTNLEGIDLLDIQVKELLNKVLKGEMEWLSDQDKFVFTGNRKAIIQCLNTIFSREISCLLRGKEYLDATALVWGLRLAGFLEASETFQWTKRLCDLSIEDLEEVLGGDFVIEELAYLLASTMDQWNILKRVIENPDLDEFVRGACLDALVFAVAKGRIDRLEISDYFKSLFSRILSGEFDDDLLCTHLVSSCSGFWPGECLEEIRESFGLYLVDESTLGLDHVLKDFSQGKEYCLEELQKQIRQHSFLEDPENTLEPFDEAKSQQWGKLFESIEVETSRLFKEPERNEVCNCGSGRKYKKCCMNKKLSLPGLPPKIRIEQSMISYASLPSDSLNAVPEAERETILDFYYLAQEDPKRALQIIPGYIESYPNIPMLYNYLYVAYHKLQRPREAIKLLKETVQIFPDYLFGRVEYTLYLLRRGEPDKAFVALGSVGTLSQLYPERKIFHASEWKSFAYAMGWYWIQKDDIDQAKIYLEIIQEISPKSAEIKSLQKKMRSRLFLRLMEKQQKSL